MGISDGCPTGKRRYPTSADADAALEQLRKLPGRRPGRLYLCLGCAGWHLSSHRRTTRRRGRRGFTPRGDTP